MTFLDLDESERVTRCVRCDAILVRSSLYRRDDAVCEGCRVPKRTDYAFGLRVGYRPGDAVNMEKIAWAEEEERAAFVASVASPGVIGATRHWPTPEIDRAGAVRKWREPARAGDSYVLGDEVFDGIGVTGVVHDPVRQAREAKAREARQRAFRAKVEARQRKEADKLQARGRMFERAIIESDRKRAGLT